MRVEKDEREKPQGSPGLKRGFHWEGPSGIMVTTCLASWWAQEVSGCRGDAPLTLGD